MSDLLSKAKGLLGGKISFTSWKTWAAMGVVLAIVAVLYYVFFGKGSVSHLYNPSSSSGQREGFDQEGKQAELILFYVDWCPHCKTAKPEWESTKSAFNGKQINGYTVAFTDINCTNETSEIARMMSTYKIEGYPTIKMIKDGQVIDFDAKPTQSSLTQFINSAI